MRIAFVVLVLVAVMHGWAACGVGEWKSYTSKRDVRAFVFDGTTIWAATGGGLFSQSIATGAYSSYAASEGLRTIDLTALAIDNGGNVWAGAANGFLHRYNPSTGGWDYIQDLYLRTDPQKRINALVAHGDTLYILSDIGISLFSISRMEFSATYSRFGAGANPLSGQVTGMAIASGSLWISTRNGIASTPVSNPNPSAPESWQVYATLQGLPSSTCNGIGTIRDTLFAATANGVARFNGVSWTLLPGSSGSNVIDLIGDIGFFLTPTRLLKYVSGDVNQYGPAFPGGVIASALAKSPSGDLPNFGVVICTQGSGTLDLNPGQVVTDPPPPDRWDVHFPPGPASNKFVGIAVDHRGVVYAGTGTLNAGGFMRFDGTTWRSYTGATEPQLAALGPNFADEFYKVSVGRDNAKWVSGWGGGTALLNDAGDIVKVFNASNGLKPSVAGDPVFTVVGGVATDSNGVTWVTDRTPGDSTAVVQFLPDSSFRYNVRLKMRDPLRVFTDVVIDQNGTKWFSNFSRFEPEAVIALFYYNGSLGISGTVNGWGSLGVNDGLTSNKIGCLAVDRDNQLWIGTDEGINIVFDPSFPAGSIAAYHPLPDQNIQDILVDPLNDKWVATKQGVFILSPDGTSILADYTAASTDGKLPDDDVASIAMNRDNGTMYFGTEKGLASLTTAAVTPDRTFDNLAVAPNPFYLPSATPLRVDGLVENASLKILAIDGGLVREFHSPGGRVAYWDGRNDAGRLVASGVYLIVVSSEDGGTVATGKVAVIRR